MGRNAWSLRRTIVVLTAALTAVIACVVLAAIIARPPMPGGAEPAITISPEPPPIQPQPNPAVVPWRSGDPAFTAPGIAPGVIGVNYHPLWHDNDDDALRAATLDRYAAAGIKWLRMDLAWAMLQPNPPDSPNGGYDLAWGVPRLNKRLDEIAAHGMRPFVVVSWPPKWSSGTAEKNGEPGNAADYGKLLGWAANRWHDKVFAWEMWNEPDLDTFYHSADPTRFADLLKTAYPVAKRVAPHSTFIAGAPTYVGTDWYRKLYAAGAKGSYDAIAVHPYMSPIDQPPTIDDGTPHVMNEIGSLIDLMRLNGEGTLNIWATEWGWSAHGNTGGEAPWDLGVTESQQAQFLLQGMEVLAKYPNVKGAFWYTDRDTAVNNIHQDRFGLLRRNLAPKPAFFALKCAASGICGP